MFYGVLAALPLMAFGGWTWWYRANFPVPFTDPSYGMSVSCFSQPAIPKKKRWVLPPAYQEFVANYQYQLIDWKVRRETSSLKLKGTRWVETACGARVAFGEDGRISWEFEPGWDQRPEIFDPFESEDSNRANWLRYGEMLNGVEYVRRGKMGLRPGSALGFSDSESLEILSTPYHAFMWFDGQTLLLEFIQSEDYESAGSYFSLSLTRDRGD